MKYEILLKSFQDLKKFCEEESFQGWDPYDGLNSWVIQKTLLGKSRLFRLAWIQLFKRNPINLRTIFGVKKDYNPKGLGLFLIGYCNLYKIEQKDEYLNKINALAEQILKLQTNGYSGACWGYNFDWQARAFFQPKYTPTIVATSFIAEALFKAYDITKEKTYLDTAISTKNFVLNDLNKTFDEDKNYTLSYSPIDNTQVFNAGLLGAKLLSLIYKYTNDDFMIYEAKKIVNYVCKKQDIDGSWTYGTLDFHKWVDNFHTGYNLECIFEYQKISNDYTFDPFLKKGLKYYVETFFTIDGISKYYNDSLYPIDIHSPAQLIVTLSKLGVFAENRDLIEKVLSWTVANMQSPKGYFYYQIKKYTTSKIPYIRWAQSWMFYAFTYYHIEYNLNEQNQDT
tara:strand:+ start:11734 stop:12921 length:1188 start_codon:yes stop_codon:yes gene_type:complete